MDRSRAAVVAGGSCSSTAIWAYESPVTTITTTTMDKRFNRSAAFECGRFKALRVAMSARSVRYPQPLVASPAILTTHLTQRSSVHVTGTSQRPTSFLLSPESCLVFGLPCLIMRSQLAVILLQACNVHRNSTEVAGLFVDNDHTIDSGDDQTIKLWRTRQSSRAIWRPTWLRIFSNS